MVQTIRQQIAGQARNDGAVLDCKPAPARINPTAFKIFCSIAFSHYRFHFNSQFSIFLSCQSFNPENHGSDIF
jgi:hypothetical protein